MKKHDFRSRAERTACSLCLLVLISSQGSYSQEITVIDDWSNTVLNDRQPSLVDEVDFGCTRPGVPVTRRFTIRNDGSDDLVLSSNGLTLPPGYSFQPGWPTARIGPEFKVVVTKKNAGAAAVDSTHFELQRLPQNISIESVSIRIPDALIEMSDGPDNQTPYIDEKSGIVIQAGSSGLDLSEVHGPGSGYYCPTPGAFDESVDGDICVEFGGRSWQQGRRTRWQKATLRFRRGALTGSLDHPSLNGDVTFGFGLAGLNAPRLRGVKNNGEAFWQAGIEIEVVLFDSLTGQTRTATGVFQNDLGMDADTNGIAEAQFGAAAGEVPVPVIIPPGSTWLQEVGTPLTVQLDAVNEGIYPGEWSLGNNDADENPFNFQITGVVDGTAPTIENLPADIERTAVANTCSAMVDWVPPTVTDNVDPEPALIQTQGLPPGTVFPVGNHTIEYTATDCSGNETVGSFTVSVKDQNRPSLVGSLPCRVIASAAPGETSAIVNFPELTAIDDCDPNPAVVCTPPSGSLFHLGLTRVCCVARDSSGNESDPMCFDVIVIETQETNVLRGNVDFVARNAEPSPGIPEAGAIFSVFNHAVLNDAGGVAIEATMLQAGANNVALWRDLGSGLEVVSRKGDTVPGTSSAISRFDDVTLNDFGEMGFEIFSGATAMHLSDASGTLELALGVGGTPPGTSARFQTLHEPAFDGQGTQWSPAHLQLGVDGVTILNDTGIWRKPAGGPLEQLVREGVPVGPAIPDAIFGHIERRVVANDGGEVAFQALLEIGTAGVTGDTNSVILSGPAGALTVVAREGDVAPGPDPALFLHFVAESINNNGNVAFEASLKTGGGGPRVDSSTNAGLYTNSNGVIELVAREGDRAPCLPDSAVFSDFRDIFIADNGDVFFHAFLNGPPPLGSHNDGSFWQWRAADSRLLPLMREGEWAPSTNGAVVSSLVDFAVSEGGHRAVTATLVPGIGDATLDNDYGLWMDDGTNGLPILKIREADKVDAGTSEAPVVAFLTFDKTTNTAGGSGGHGKVLSDAGDIIVNISFSLDTTGVVVIRDAPPAP